MSNKPLSPKQKSELTASFIGDIFIEAARYLREVQDDTPELFATVVKYTGSACPIRIANLTIIEIGRHLVADGKVYRLKFSLKSRSERLMLSAGTCGRICFAPLQPPA